PICSESMAPRPRAQSLSGARAAAGSGVVQSLQNRVLPAYASAPSRARGGSMKRSLLLLPLLTLAVLVNAQEFRGSLTGRVTDPAGLGVPNAKVIATKTDTNTRSETVSGPDGSYTLPFLAPGPYEVAIAVEGFKKFTRSGVDVGTNQRVAVDIPLQIGATSESVSV